mmetsp:Transcript_1644/g.3326  ORF Transcript_1644/g.3326 Transcript_1644/m.3326 type:complete len:225 (-) Transcript_1644:551-1225(-)
MCEERAPHVANAPARLVSDLDVCERQRCILVRLHVHKACATPSGSTQSNAQVYSAIPTTRQTKISKLKPEHCARCSELFHNPLEGLPPLCCSSLDIDRFASELAMGRPVNNLSRTLRMQIYLNLADSCALFSNIIIPLLRFRSCRPWLSILLRQRDWLRRRRLSILLRQIEWVRRRRRLLSLRQGGWWHGWRRLRRLVLPERGHCSRLRTSDRRAGGCSLGGCW